MRVEFFLEMCKELKKVQAVVTSDKELISLIKNMRKYLREGTEDLETDQQAI